MSVSSINRIKFQGLYGVLVTPFQLDGELDEESLERLVEFYLDKQVHGLVTLSVLGEEAQLTQSERKRVAEIVLKQVNNRVPVVVGVSGEASVAIPFGLQMAVLGAKGLLVVPPIFPSIEQVKQHYQAIGTATELPLVILDYPPLTGKLPVQFLQNLVEEVEQVQAIKLEEEPTSEKIRQLRALTGDKLYILGGLGGLHCLGELQAGSDGLMTGYAYPEHLVTIIDYFRKGQLAAATKEYQLWLPLLRHEQKQGLALRKELLRRRGVISCAKVRASWRSWNLSGYLSNLPA
jgi:4-hydroxy-tetrahydrodipicolinate synthase